MIARSLSGTHPSLGGLEAARAIALATAIGGVCPAGRPAPSRSSSESLESDVTGIVSRYGRHYHEMERLAAWRGRDSKDRRNYSAQMGGADPGP